MGLSITKINFYANDMPLGINNHLVKVCAKIDGGVNQVQGRGKFPLSANYFCEWFRAIYKRNMKEK